MFGKKSFREWKRDLQKEMMLLNEKIRGAKKKLSCVPNASPGKKLWKISACPERSTGSGLFTGCEGGIRLDSIKTPKTISNLTLGN